MKKYLIILALTAIFSSCKKDKPVSALNGTWELHSIAGPFSTTSEPVKLRYVITNENQYVLSALGNELEHGIFILNLDKQSGEYRSGNIVFGQSSKVQEFHLKADTFIIGTISPDSPSAKYARIKK
ncbi:MAG: hypothetical protein JKY70_20290 [Mucilaginibacter sp.]|nr:hypothetical protein [Mucilaginibacter sp.]